jgi:hypothetical protein
MVVGLAEICWENLWTYKSMVGGFCFGPDLWLRWFFQAVVRQKRCGLPLPRCLDSILCFSSLLKNGSTWINMEGLHFSGWWFGTSNIFRGVGIPPASFVQPKNFYQSVGRTDGSWNAASAACSRFGWHQLQTRHQLLEEMLMWVITHPSNVNFWVHPIIS